ncbi:MAG TPA: hypothetical protein VHL58_13020 [Thermoanaerobaculia bacterium]|nr:hypothetical protein [Thermoanaerobaculia bacterium]
MKAYGSDRLQTRRPGEIILVSPYDKGWLPRKPKSGTSAEFPGTAVQSEDAHFEVVDVVSTPSGRVRYVLEPWKDINVIRVVEHYDEASEAQRLDAHQKTLLNSRKATSIGLLGVVYGHLPASAQNEIESEYGLPAVRMTMISTIPAFLFGAYCAARIPIPGLKGLSGSLPITVVFTGLFLFFESVVRLRRSLDGQPIGSLFGVAIYWIVRGVRHLRGAPPADPVLPNREISPQLAADLDILTARDRRYKLRQGQRLTSTSPLPITPAQQLLDLYHSREPFLALLSPPEQKLLAELFVFDYIAWGRTTVYWLMAAAVTGMASAFFSISMGAFTFRRILSGLVAGALLAEQISRLRRIDQGQPAGSVLGFAIRPLARKLLGADTSVIHGPPPDEIDAPGQDNLS